MSKTVTLLITGLTTFIITAGTAIIAVDTNGAMPSEWALTCAAIGGLVQAAMTIQKKLEQPPT